jgi:hypothetical protein
MRQLETVFPTVFRAPKGAATVRLADCLRYESGSDLAPCQSSEIVGAKLADDYLRGSLERLDTYGEASHKNTLVR